MHSIKGDLIRFILCFLLGVISNAFCQQSVIRNCISGLGELGEFEPSCFDLAFGVPIHDPEYSPNYDYAAWQKSPKRNPDGTVRKHGKIFVAPVDPFDGDILILQVQVVPGCFPVFYDVMGNGPEWGISLRGQEVFYSGFTQGLEQVRMERVVLDEQSGLWQKDSTVPDSYRKAFGFATHVEDLPAPKLNFQKFSGSFLNDTLTAQVGGWREDTQVPIDVLVSYKSPASRWIQGTEKLVYIRRDVSTQPATKDLVIHDTISGVDEFVYDEEGIIGQVGGWVSPELGGEPGVFATVIYSDKTVLKVFRSDGLGNWQFWTTIESFLPNFPHVFGPEVFAFEGKSYAIMMLWKEVGTAATIPQAGHVGLVTVDPDLPNEEKVARIVSIDEPNTLSVKGDPEFIFVQGGSEVRIIYKDHGIPE